MLGVLFFAVGGSDEVKKFMERRKQNILKESDHAFILNEKKAQDFLKQDNTNFTRLMEKFNKYTKSSSHSNPIK